MALLAFNRSYVTWGRQIRSLECSDDILRILWKDWTNSAEGGAGWAELGLSSLVRTRISTAALGANPAPSDLALLFRHDYGIDLVLLGEDRAPAYGGWIMSQELAVLDGIVHGHRLLGAEAEAGRIGYAFDPASGVYQPQSRAFNLVTMRRLITRAAGSKARGSASVGRRER